VRIIPEVAEACMSTRYQSNNSGFTYEVLDLVALVCHFFELWAIGGRFVGEGQVATSTSC